jgi:hypothetical protein
MRVALAVKDSGLRSAHVGKPVLTGGAGEEGGGRHAGGAFGGRGMWEAAPGLARRSLVAAFQKAYATRQQGCCRAAALQGVICAAIACWGVGSCRKRELALGNRGQVKRRVHARTCTPPPPPYNGAVGKAAQQRTFQTHFGLSCTGHWDAIGVDFTGVEDTGMWMCSKAAAIVSGGPLRHREGTGRGRGWVIWYGGAGREFKAGPNGPAAMAAEVAEAVQRCRHAKS